MSAYYKMDPADWDFGTSSLSLEEEAAYLRVINAIHKHDQPVPNNDRVLAGMFRCSTRKARSLISALINAGKLRIEGDCIVNDKALSDIVRRQSVSGSRSESGAKGGRRRAENAAKALEYKKTEQAIASSRIEENRIEYPEANASGRDASPAEPVEDFSKQLFDRAVAFLGRHGVLERHARGIVGKWRRDHTDAAILDAFTACSRAGAIDPVPWIAARLGASERASASVIPLDRVAAAALANLKAEAERKAASR